MSWQNGSLIGVRERFVLEALQRRGSFTELCSRFNIARCTGYKWLCRFRAQGRAGLFDRSRRPHHPSNQLDLRWRQAIRQLRRRHPRWGPRKLRARLRYLHPRVHLPASRTIGRWLRRMGLVRPASRRQRQGPWLSAPKRKTARKPNDIWTIDFKGWFRTRDSCRVDPLTIRDLKSRFILDVRLLANQSDQVVRRAIHRVFSRYGLPKVIRVDNGPPFGGIGPRGWSRLSVWWRRLGIEVDFGRPAHPQDNAQHEQMHSVYQAEAADLPAINPLAQQRRSDRWRRDYNHLRPHEALRMLPPARYYRPSTRRLTDKLPAWPYPAGWTQRRVTSDGRLFWHGRQRFIGRAFGSQIIGLRPSSKGLWKVYLGPDLLGLLYQHDHSRSLRPVRLIKS